MRYAAWGLLALVLVVVAGFAVWRLGPRRDEISEEILRLNHEGVGYLEQFDYKRAIETFQIVTKRAPNWLPGQIHYGIALLNFDDKAHHALAEEIFHSILKRSPENMHANYCLGILKLHYGDCAAAIPRFEFVAQKDPNDVHTWDFLAQCHRGTPEPNYQKALECYEKALALNAAHGSAVYSYWSILRLKDAKKAEQFLETHKALKAAEVDTESKIIYTKMGKYAEATTTTPARPTVSSPMPIFIDDANFKASLAPETRWANSEDLAADPVGRLLQATRKRFGGAMVLADVNQDEKIDIILLGAVVRKGMLGNVLFRNEGGGKFTDVTEAHGLAFSPAAVGGVAVDFNNDGSVDFLLTTIDGLKLYRNQEGKSFQDCTKEAQLDSLHGVVLFPCFSDLDLDGDLDLVAPIFAEKAGDALSILESVPKDASFIKPQLFLNVGVAEVVSPNQRGKLSAKFQRNEKAFEAIVAKSGPVTRVLATDVDLDRDPDLVILAGSDGSQMLVNDRLLRFRSVSFSTTFAKPWHTGLVLDCRRQEVSDLFLQSPTEKPSLLLNTSIPSDLAKIWSPGGAVDSKPLAQAQAVDLNLDGWTDLLGVDEQGEIVLLRNESGSFLGESQPLGNRFRKKKNLSISAADLDNRGEADVLVWNQEEGLVLLRSQGNGNKAISLALTGMRKNNPKMRVSSDAEGVRVTAHAGLATASMEKTTTASGLGQSSLPVRLGIGKNAAADVVRVRWPDRTWQAELNVQAGARRVVEQLNREPVSCPLLFAWDGTRFRFIADFLGAGSIGEQAPDGSHRKPRPEESLALPPGSVQEKNGKYIFRIAEPMDEVTYLDRLQLQVVDHPVGIAVTPDERFDTAGMPPSQDLLLYAESERLFPAKATTHQGKDVTQTLRFWDRDTVPFAKRSWIGFAEEHAVILDFEDRLRKLPANQPMTLMLAGWTDYPYPESIWAAAQAKVEPLFPVFERWDENANAWAPWQGEAGFIAGHPRRMCLDVTGKLAGSTRKIRIRSNLHVHWDELFVVPTRERISAKNDASTVNTEKGCRIHRLDVEAARLEDAGCVQEYFPDGNPPAQFDLNRRVPVPITRQTGKLTRWGDVAELLRERDDCFVVFAAGDEVEVAFDASKLPSLPEGWSRSFVLRTWGYCKDASPFTATGTTVEPLPFHAMSNFPPGPGERYPETPKHREYLRTYQTREVGNSR